MVFSKNQAGRIFGLVGNGVLVAQVVYRQLADDPVLFALHASRRLPYALSTRLASLLLKLPGTGFAALGHQILGQKELYEPAQKLLKQPGRGIQKRIAAEVAIGYGLVSWRDDSLPAITRARAAWDAGAVEEAVKLAEAAGARSYADRLRAEIRMLDSEYKVFVDAPVRRQKTQTAHKNFPEILENTEKLSALYLLTNSLPATQSGYTLRSQRLLTALQARGIEVEASTRIGYPVTIGSLTAADTASVAGLTYQRTLPLRLAKTHPERLSQWAHILLKKARHNPPQLVHTTTNYPNALVAAAVAEHLRVPWIYEARGIMEETWVSTKKTAAATAEAESSKRFRLIRDQETRMMLRADHTITLSETMKNIFVARGIPAQKITVIPNAIDIGLLEQNLTTVQARKQLGLDSTGFWVGSVSSLVGYEGFDTLLQAVAQLRRQGRDVRVLLAGDGAARAQLQHLAADLAADPSVGEFAVFLGKISEKKALLAHQALDLFAVPRRNDRVCHSVTPLKPIEAMALGRAVVMSDIPPLSELVNNGVSGPPGRLCTAENPESFAAAISDLMNSDTERAACAASGREFARTRTWAHNAARLEDLYSRLVKESRVG